MTKNLNKKTQQVARIPRATTPAPINPMAMLEKALTTGLDPSTLEKLMNLADRWQQSQAKIAFDDAMCNFQAMELTIFKNKEVNFGNTSYKHATLDHLCDVVRPVLIQHGFTFRWETEQKDGKIGVTCVISHRQGYSVRNQMWGDADESGKKNPIQQIGSTTTYLQRYTLFGALGQAAQEDNDGRGLDQGTGIPEVKLNDFQKRIEQATTIEEATAICTEGNKACKEHGRDIASYSKIKAVFANRRNVINATNKDK